LTVTAINSSRNAEFSLSLAEVETTLVEKLGEGLHVLLTLLQRSSIDSGVWEGEERLLPQLTMVPTG
jgi:hypothetical protein